MQRYFKFTLTRAQQRSIFVYRTVTPATLVGVDLDALLLVLKSQNRVAPNATKAQMCDMLMAPFKRVFLDQRAQLRGALDKIRHAKTDWASRLAPLASTRAAHAARKALIARQEAAAEVAREAALRKAADEVVKPSRSGKRKAPAGSDSAAKKQKETSDATVTPRNSSLFGAAPLVATYVATERSVERTEGIEADCDGHARHAVEELDAAFHACEVDAARLAKRVVTWADEEDEDDALPTTPGGNDQPKSVDQAPMNNKGQHQDDESFFMGFLNESIFA